LAIPTFFFLFLFLFCKKEQRKRKKKVAKKKEKEKEKTLIKKHQSYNWSLLKFFLSFFSLLLSLSFSIFYLSPLRG